MRSLEFLFVVALVLYSFVIWSHRFTKRLDAWMIWLFGVGLVADISGTVFVCIIASARWSWTLHTISGLLALLIMSLHFVWVILANSKKGKWKIYFNRFSVYAWCLWMAAFISGVPH